MNLAGLPTAVCVGRAPCAGAADTVGAGEMESDAGREAAEEPGFAALLELPSQPWASGWQATEPLAPAWGSPGAGMADTGPGTEETAGEGDGEVLPRLAAATARDAHLATGAALPRDGRVPASDTSVGSATAPLPAHGDTASMGDELSRALPAATPGLAATLRGDGGPATSDGSLARPAPAAEATDATRPQPDRDLPARTLAMLDDALHRPVRLLAAASGPGPALQAAQPTPELVAVPVLGNAPTPAPLPPREALPGHLHLATPRTPHGDESAEQLNARLNWMASHQVTRAQIRLSPPHLGRVEIDLEIRDGKVRADFGANTAEARALLEAGLPRLREMFSAQGLQLVHSEVSASLAQGQGHHPDAQARRDSQAGDGRSAAGRGPDPEEGAGEAESGTVPARSGRGLVDEFA